MSADRHRQTTQSAYETYASYTLMRVPSWQMLSGAEQLAWSRAIEEAREPLQEELATIREKLAHIGVALGEL